MREMLDSSLGGNIQIEMKFGTDLWPVEIDVGELELAMLNLCVNARDAMAVAAPSRLPPRTCKRPGENGLLTDFVKLSIADTGSGMPPEVLARVFEPFFTTKDVGQGVGTGLAAGLWFRAAVRGSTHDRQPGRSGHYRDAAVAAFIAAAALRPRSSDDERARRSKLMAHAVVRCCLSKTTMKSRRSPERC